MEDSDVLPYLPTKHLPPVKKYKASIKSRAWNLAKAVPVRVVNKTSSVLHVSRRASVFLLLLFLAVGGGTVYASFGLSTSSSASVNGGKISNPVISTSSTADTPGSCVVSSSGRVVTCSGTVLANVTDSYTITETITIVPPSTVPSCTSSSTGSLSAATPTVTGSSSPFTVSTVVSATGPGTGSVSVDC
jgi:hypothetical protein